MATSETYSCCTNTAGSRIKITREEPPSFSQLTFASSECIMQRDTGFGGGFVMLLSVSVKRACSLSEKCE